MNNRIEVAREFAEAINCDKIGQNHISNVLRQLKDHELVECINLEVKKGRLYRLTEKGNELFKNLE